MKTFHECCPDLLFTHELPVGKSIKFLDLALEFKDGHVCWRYEPRSSKGFLPFASCHSKTVKRSVANTALVSALRKSCNHQADASFQKQMARLRDSGYPGVLLGAVCEAICRKFSRGSPSTERDRQTSRANFAVVPYIHGVTHRLKKIAARQNVRVVCSAPNRGNSMCRQVNRATNRQPTCNTAHRNKYTMCQTGVVYKIPMSCGSCYIGQTGRCVNDRVREHAASVQGTGAGHLAAHCRTCGCRPQFSSVSIMNRHRNAFAREILEALAIEQTGDDCVSMPSITVSKKERQFLQCGTAP